MLVLQRSSKTGKTDKGNKDNYPYGYRGATVLSHLCADNDMTQPAEAQRSVKLCCRPISSLCFGVVTIAASV